MKLTNDAWLRAGRRMAVWTIAALAGMALNQAGSAQAVSTTTVQGTVYLANGQPGTGSLTLSWPTFTTATGQVVTAASSTVAVAPDGFVSVNLAPNEGATPAGLYYTAVFYLSDGTVSTQYWVVPATAQATLAQVQAQVMPAAQAVKAVSKTYVDQSITQLTQSLLTASGGNISGPLYLSGDPTQALQAADKHYVDVTASADAAAAWPAQVLRADQFAGADFGAKVQACVNAVDVNYGGTCDARNFTGSLSMASNLTVATGNTTILLPCATITTASQAIVTAGTRNVSLRGCALRGGSAASGSQGGTVFAYTGSRAMVQVGDPTYAVDTPGFHMDNVAINTTGASSATAQGVAAYRTQEMDLESLYLLGNANQTGMTLDGTGNYTGGTFQDDEIGGYQTAVNAIGHQVANAATTDWVNASTFVRLHIDCPTSSGNPIAGTYGINLQQGDGNTFTGGDVEGCATALHLGANAQNNTIVGLRNENSTVQVAADTGSAYNNWMTGGTMFTGKLVDNGTRNSFLDTFHRSFNGMTGDWYGSQQDATITNHYRLGTGTGNERGLLDRYQTDYGYRWTMGLSDATAGEQFYQVLDELNNVYRISVGQYNHGQSSTNNQTVINAAGTGAVVLNGSNNAGTGGVIFGSGGSSATTVATVGNTGNAQFNGALLVGGTTQSTGTLTVRNNADSEVDYYLWPGLTASQKGSFTYKDWNGNSQWYLVKDASNNWALNSAVGGLDSFKAYQSTNSGDTYINASNSTGHIRLNYESGSGAETDIYSGSSSSLAAAFLGPTAIKLPGLAALSGHFCLQIDTSGYITNTGSACGTGSGGGSSINSGTTGQIAYYTANGTSIGGLNAVPVTAGGTGASTAAGALANLGGLALSGGTLSGALSGTSAGFSGSIAAATNASATRPVADVTHPGYGALCDGVHDDTAAFQAALAASYNATSGLNTSLFIPPQSQCLVHELDLTPYNNVHIFSTSETGAKIYYDGAGGAGSYLFKTNGTAFGGFEHLRMIGTNPSVSVAAENILVVASGGVDLMMHMDDVQFASCLGDAIEQTGAGYTNWFMRRIRFDGVGGYGISLVGSTTMEARPFELSEFTLDNQITGTWATLAAATTNPSTGQPYYDGTHWGKGLLYINNMDGMDIELHSGRMESNKPLIPQGTTHDEALLLYEAGTDGYGNIRIDHVDGFGNNTAQAPLVSVATANKVGVDMRNSGFYHVSASVKERDTQAYYGQGESTAGWYRWGFNSAVARGFNLNDHKTETVSLSAMPGRYDLWKAGDINWHPQADILPGQRGVAQYVVAPATGLSMPVQATITSAAVVTAGNTTITNVSASNADIPGANITVTGAGTSGTNLNTQITAVNYDAQTITVADTPSTSVNPATIKWQAPVFHEWGMDATRASAAPTTGTWGTGEVVWNSNLASGQPVGWTCASGGTPCGSWLAMPTYPSGGTGGLLPNTPTWLQYLGDGSDGAYSLTSGTAELHGDYYYTTFNVSSGAILTSQQWLTVHATGACTVNGTMIANGSISTLSGGGIGGASSGGSGGGTSAGTIGAASYANLARSGYTFANGGGAGASSGGNGNGGSALSTGSMRVVWGGGIGTDGQFLNGATGVAGANSGGAAGGGGSAITLICGSFNGSGGVIDVSGNPGGPSAANSTGAGSGGGGGPVMISSANAVSNWPTVYYGGGAGGQATVPYAVPAGTSSVASGSICHTQPVLTLTVSGGVPTACTVTVAGNSCGTSPAINWAIQGGGSGSGATITPVWSGGAVSSCTVSGGTGYTNSTTFTTSGSGGQGGYGWVKEASGW